MNRTEDIGPVPLEDGRWLFRVWAPRAERVEVEFVSPTPRTEALEPKQRGYHEAILEKISPGTCYFYRLDGGDRLPDPVSRHQPEGPHGPSEVIDPAAFKWSDSGWRGLPMKDLVLYELHPGTFTTEGTFEAAIERLDALKELGVTMIELMPVAQFPGTRNWGYDGTYPWAAQNSYGGPAGLARLVDACHARGLGVCLDVVYNHLGPEGNYTEQYGPYFTDVYHTPWGKAMNFDQGGADEVRRYFIGSALWWTDHLHVDALRVDAIHAIYDASAYPFLRELADRVHERAAELGREVLVISESDLNDPRVVRSTELSGDGHDGQWSDDFHHALHALLTGEQRGYYADFGDVGHLAAAYEDAFVYANRYSKYRRRHHGDLPRTESSEQFVVFAQNHDQVGNRLKGDRLSTLVDFEAQKLVAASVAISPYVPLLFMGEEYGETNPFLYFISHTDPGLVQAVRRGRKEEFSAFEWGGEPPDPQSEETFRRCRLEWDRREKEGHRELLELHRYLLARRREHPALGCRDRNGIETRAQESSRTLVLTQHNPAPLAAVLNFSDSGQQVRLNLSQGRWAKLLDTAEERWAGPGSEAPAQLGVNDEIRLRVPAHAAIVYVKEAA